MEREREMGGGGGLVTNDGGMERGTVDIHGSTIGMGLVCSCTLEKEGAFRELNRSHHTCI